MIHGGSRIDYELTADQHAAVEAAATPGTVIIIGPLGSGRSRVAEEVTLSALASGQRVVITAPLFGLQAFERRLRDIDGPWKTVRVDLRSLQGKQPGEEAEPPYASVSLLSPELLRHTVVREAVLSLRPSVLVVDDLDLLPRDRVDQLIDLASVIPALRLVLTAEDPSRVPRRALLEAGVREFHMADLHSAGVDRETIGFERSKEEAQLIAWIGESVPWLRDTTQLRSPIDAVGAALDSSWAAVDQRLLRLRRRVEETGYWPVEEEMWDLGDEIDVPDPHDRAAALERVDELLSAVDSLSSDTKVEALLGSRIWPPAGEVDSVCIVTGFGATAEYLAEALGESIGPFPFVFLRDFRGPASIEDLDAFRDRGGVCVITDRALQAYDLGKVEAFVHYDIPASRRRFHRRAGRLVPLESGKTAIAAVLNGRPSTFRPRDVDLLRGDGFNLAPNSGHGDNGEAVHR